MDVIERKNQLWKDTFDVMEKAPDQLIVLPGNGRKHVDSIRCRWMNSGKPLLWPSAVRA